MNLHEKSAEERLERAIVRYRKEKLLSGEQMQLPDSAATVIPFPSEEAPADGKRPDPQATHDVLEDAVPPSPAQRWWCIRARRRTAKKKPTKRWDWSEFQNVREKPPEERLERAIARYRKEKRLGQQHRQLPDTTETIIPFRSEQAQAASGSGDPPGDT